MEGTQDLQDRIERFRELNELNPGSRFFAPLADLLRQDGCYEEALALLEEGLDRHPEYQAGLVIRGRTLLETGRNEEAIETWRQVLAADPENLLALESLAVMELDACAWAGAVPLLERLCELVGDDSVWYGSLLEARGHLARQEREAAPEPRVDLDGLPEAEVEISAPKPDTGSSFDTMTLVDIYLAQGYRDRALAVLRRMLPGAGDSRDEIQERIRLLENVDGVDAPVEIEKQVEPERIKQALMSPEERMERDRERSLRREAERKRFEEWLEKIRFNGEAGE